MTSVSIVASVISPNQLVYGMQLPIQSQSRIYVEPWELEAGAGDGASGRRVRRHIAHAATNISPAKARSSRSGSAAWFR